MENRLFVVEGLPGVGKSTTSKFIGDLLIRNGYNTKWVDEGTGNHPADYECHSFMTEEEIHQLDPKEQGEVLKVAKIQDEGFVIPLNQLQKDLFNKLLPYKIYDVLPWEKENKVMIKGWRSFAEEAEKEEVYVFNCCVLQNPMCETMIRFNLPYGLSKGYIKHIFYEIREMQPIVIYLSQTNVADRIASVVKERGSAWLEQVIDYHVKGMYGKEHHLNGLEGYIACLEERQKREIKILQELDTPHFIVENPYEDWERTYSDLEKYIGRFMHKEHNHLIYSF